ncbi:Mitochondrial ribonuclease P protein 3 [Myotis brandtii]|uniref:Mitochondrial ribonuclease P protein 3 n=1 Tax=Myotis brandtii TaxID=109478 RepID=S7PA07_MYOBR|nr:Mitochondrial ribonuclease P protein 3 [Myotis brandtii]
MPPALQPHSPAWHPTMAWCCPSPDPPFRLQGNCLGPGPPPSSLSTWELGTPPPLLVAICRAIGPPLTPAFAGSAHSPPPSHHGPTLVGPIRAGSTSTAIRCQCHIADACHVLHRPLVLLNVVSQLAKHNLRVLVLGRKHMTVQRARWRKDEMEKVQKQASCFFADNISEDDPFLLYATLHSGNHCKFITKDLLRDHKACLPDAKTQRLFFKWQQGHQLAIINRFPGSKITFQHIPSYDTVVQTTGDSWHIPYDEDLVERYSYEVPTKWLCLHRKT